MQSIHCRISTLRGEQLCRLPARITEPLIVGYMTAEASAIAHDPASYDFRQSTVDFKLRHIQFSTRSDIEGTGVGNENLMADIADYSAELGLIRNAQKGDKITFTEAFRGAGTIGRGLSKIWHADKNPNTGEPLVNPLFIGSATQELNTVMGWRNLLGILKDYRPLISRGQPVQNPANAITVFPTGWRHGTSPAFKNPLPAHFFFGQVNFGPF